MELERLKNSLYDADVKYSQMKRIEDDSLYEGIQKGTTKELTQAKLDKKFRNTNGKLNEYLSGLDAPSRERLEIEAIKNTLERNIKETMGGKRVVDYSGMLKTLKDNPNYKSEAAKKAIEITEKMNKIHGLDHALADAFKAPKDPKLQQGFSHNVAVRYLTMDANRAVQNTVKFLPFLQMGKTAASRHAIYNAVMSSSSARELGEKLSKAAMNKDIPVSEKIDIIEMAKAQFKFSNELDKAKADGIVKEATTKQENNVIKKGEAPGQHPGANFANESAPMAKDSQGLAFSPYKDDAQRVAQTNNDIILQNSAKGGAAEQGSKLEQAEAKQEVVKGEGWTMKDGTVAKKYAEHKFEPEKWINDLSGVLSDEWIANLKSLALKHPEMFKSEADVFRVIKEIKDNPTHFFKNNRDDIALVSKILDDGSIGKVGIVKDSGKVGHVSKSSNKKELKRLQAVNEKQLGVGAPHPTLRSSVSPLAEQKAGANAHSLATETIISQKGNLVNEAETNGLRNSVSSIGDNASRAGGRQAGDEQILRQGRRDTANASQAKRPAASDGQVEQPGAAKTDGEVNAAATTKQVVEKQGSGASIGGLTANSNAHLGSGTVAGTLNSVDEEGNFSPERFAAGFLAGLLGGKAIATGLRKMTPKLYNQILGADEVEIWQKTGWFKDEIDDKWKFEIGDSNAKLNPGFQSGGRLGELLDHKELFKAYPELKDVRVVKIGDQTPDGAALSVKDAAQREKRGIYNVTYNDKTATLVRQDLDDINSALLYERGDKEVGAKHTRIRHLRDENKVGYVKDTELLNLGENIRAFIKKYKEPFMDKRGARIYEWQDENGIRFRVVVDNRRGNGQTPPPASENIRTFYSDRNLKDRMDFKNPKVKYDVNLNEWHKDSAPVTKNADRSPKVFYHGSLAKDITEFKSEFDNIGIGFWFADKDYAANHGEGNLYETFLRIKNPLDLREENVKYPFELMREMQRKGLSLEPYGKTSKEAKEFLKQNGYDGIVLDGDYKERPEDGSLRVDGYSKKDIDNILVKQSALEELAGVGDKSRLKNMSFEVKAAYRNELDPIKKEAILKTAELNKLKKAAAAKFEEFKARNLDENGNIKDGLSLC